MALLGEVDEKMNLAQPSDDHFLEANQPVPLIVTGGC